MPFIKRRSIQLIDLFLATAVAAICAALWRHDEILGSLAMCVGLSAIIYYINHVRTWPPFLVSTLVAIPFIVTALFCSTLALELHMPAIDVPSDWRHPPFVSFQERLEHAFGLSMIGLFVSTCTILLFGIIRRLSIIYRGTVSQGRHDLDGLNRNGNKEDLATETAR
jgi:hypothetical protein